MATVHFTPKTGKIEKQTARGPVSLTIDDAIALWRDGAIEDCNIAFRRLAVDFAFNVETAMNWYKKYGIKLQANKNASKMHSCNRQSE